MMGNFTLTHPQEVQSDNLRLFSSSSTIVASTDLEGLRAGMNIICKASVAIRVTICLQSVYNSSRHLLLKVLRSCLRFGIRTTNVAPWVSSISGQCSRPPPQIKAQEYMSQKNITMKIHKYTNKWKAINYKNIICHKSTNNIGALVTMCGRDEECFTSVRTCWKVAIAYVGWKAMGTLSIIKNKHHEN
jgi:hypothetical protein